MAEDTSIDIEYVARLARLELTDAEKEEYTRQLGVVLDNFKKLAEVDVEGVEASAHAFPVYNVWGEDLPKDTYTVEQALQNANPTRDNQVQVPKVVGDS